MEYFGAYVKLGWDHILDLDGYDHILFIAALSGIYIIKQWRQILLLVTAFTVGHSLTLLLASLQVVWLPSPLVEFLIPCTIAYTCVTNWFSTPSRPSEAPNIMQRYFAAFLFGLVHGMGFSNYLRQLFVKSDNIIVQLLGFNVGLELGQMVVVAIILLIGTLLFAMTPLRLRDWNLVLSSFILALALQLCVKQGAALAEAMEAGPIWQRPGDVTSDSTSKFNPFNRADSLEVSTDTAYLAPGEVPATRPMATPVEDSLPKLKVTVDSTSR